MNIKDLKKEDYKIVIPKKLNIKDVKTSPITNTIDTIVEKKPSLVDRLKGVAGAIVPELKGFAESITGAIAAPAEARRQQEQVQRQIGTTADILRQSQELKVQGKTEEANKLLEDYIGMQEIQAVPTGVETLQKIVPAAAKTEKQVAGEAIGTILDIASAGVYGKGLQATKTVGEAALSGAVPSALFGTGFGISGAMQEDKELKDILGRGALGGVIGGAFGASLNALSKGIQNKAFAKKLEEKAIDQYKKGFKATTNKQKEVLQKITPDLVKSKIWGTQKNLLEKASAGVKLSREEYKKLGKLEGIANIQGVYNKIDDEIARYTLPGGKVPRINKTKVLALNDLKGDLDAIKILNQSRSNPQAYQQSLRELSEMYGKALYDTSKSLKTVEDNAVLSQVKKVDSVIRSLLAKENPTYAEINKVNTLSSRLKGLIEENIKRKTGQDAFGLMNTIAAGAGIITGAPSGIASAGGYGLGLLGTMNLLKSTWFNTLSAINKQKIAEQLSKISLKEIPEAVKLIERQFVKQIVD